MSSRNGLGVEVPDVGVVFGVVSWSHPLLSVLEEERDEEVEEERAGNCISWNFYNSGWMIITWAGS